MSLELHKDCKERLKVVLTDSLRNATVVGNAHIDRYSLEALKNADDILPTPKRELVRSWIGEHAVRTFVYEWFLSKFEKNKYDEAQSSVPLTSVKGCDDVAHLASEIISGFSSLPWKYSFVIPLPSSVGQVFSRAHTKFEVTDDIRIITPSGGLNGIPPPPHRYAGQILPEYSSLSALLLNNALAKPSWDDNNAYIQFDIDGFVGRFEETVPTTIARDNLKELFGVGFGLRLLQRKFSPDAMSKTASFCIYRFVDGVWLFERWLDMDSPASQLFLSAVLWRSMNESLPDDLLVENTMEELRRIRTVFRDPKAARLPLAGHWLFDSISNSDELLGFVQATVAMEILLAERSEAEKVGITELIKNRCAFLLARTIDEREMIMRDFPLIYDVRSRIVHQGKRRLDAEEKSLLRKLNWLCTRVIWREARLFYRSDA